MAQVRFNEVEASCLLTVPEPCDVPRFTRVKVHRDFHVEVTRALYSLREQRIGHYVEARSDSETVLAAAPTGACALGDPHGSSGVLSGNVVLGG
ncbi:MAG: Mu transposase domain-containing protein [Propionibacteriaceae bacterium]